MQRLQNGSGSTGILRGILTGIPRRSALLTCRGPRCTSIRSSAPTTPSNGLTEPLIRLHVSIEDDPLAHTPPSIPATHTAVRGGLDAAAAVASSSACHKPKPLTTLKSQTLSGGNLDLVTWEGDRLLRIWTPPGFCRSEPPSPQGWPVLYLNDGQNLFDDGLSFSGCSWRAAETAASLINSGTLPPFIIVGMDHSGASRSLDYTPYRPGTGPGGFRKDAADWPGGGVDAYLEKVVTEVMPYARNVYGAASDPDLVAFGGSSFGGICTLIASMRRPGLFGAALVESPSLWLAEERVLTEDIAQYRGGWPERIFIGMGGKEYSGIRRQEAGQDAFDKTLAGYVPALKTALKAQNVTGERIMTVVDPEASHTESAWMARLPSALTFLLSPWWGVLARGRDNDLYFTVPPRIRAGEPATLLVNSRRSDSLSGCEELRLLAGFNDWSHKCERSMEPLPHNTKAPHWHAVRLMPPADAYEMEFTLSDQKGQVWDNCNGNNFYHRISQLPSGVTRGPVPSVKPSAAHDLEDVAKRQASQLFFLYPERPVAGQGFMLCMNRVNSDLLRDSPNIKLHYGFNNWEMGCHLDNMTPTQLWRNKHADWWGVPLVAPEGAVDMCFCFTDGQGLWDNHSGGNYAVGIQQQQQQSQTRSLNEALQHTGEAGIPAVRLRTVAKEEVLVHAGGHLHILSLSKRNSGDKVNDRNAMWSEEKVIRVWTPPGYERDSAPPGGWPVLYVNDAQNKFECWLAHQGVSWRLGYTAAELISSGDIPPLVIVGMDNPGPMRSLNYLPYAPGSGVGGFRGDAARWPGGGVEQYMQRLLREVMPMVTEQFCLATDPARVAFGGGSFGGVNALYASLHYPHVFGSILAESPSLWIAEGRFIEDMWAHKGMLPERIFLGCGTKEYSATRDHEREDVDNLLLHYYKESARCLESKGLRGGNNRLMFQIEEDAGHHELAWQWRLTGALKFLLGPWRH